MKKLLINFLVLLFLIPFSQIVVGCSEDEPVTQPPVNNDPEFDLTLVAESQTLWTGVAVSQEGRIFVNYPRWRGELQFSVAEITSGTPSAFPDQDWNNWEATLNPAEHLVCVQSVYVDKHNYLWVLDSGNPFFQGCINDAAKLLKIDLTNNQVIQIFPFPRHLVYDSCYLNDVRIDTERNFAYLTDSGNGAIFIMNLNTGEVKRRLNTHESTKAENITLTIENREWRTPVHSDGLALDPTGEFLYYQALTGRTLYRINTEYLRDFTLLAADINNQVERVGTSGASDGIEFGPDGFLYLTSIELNSIRRFDIVSKRVDLTLVNDNDLKWPDSFSITSDQSIYVTTSHLHLGASTNTTFKLFKITEQ